MDPARISAYLRAACSVLDFDIGELWCARKDGDGSVSLKFIQLYTSPTYEDFHSLLVQPDRNPDYRHRDEDKHRFSPIICRGVCDGGQIVWANTKISEGLTGRSDMPLNTAVGVPICSIGNDIFILVLFAINCFQMDNKAVEYLMALGHAVELGSSGGFLAVSYSSRVKAPETKDFVGLWDIPELIRSYANGVDFKILPMGKLQKYFDCHEILLFCELFHDFKMSRDGKFTAKQLESLRGAYFSERRGRSESIDSQSSTAWGEYEYNLCDQCKDAEESNVAPRPESLDPFDSTINQSQMRFSMNAEKNHKDSHYFGSYLSNNFPCSSSMSSSSANGPGQVLEALQDPHAGTDGELDDGLMHVYAHMSYKLSQCRFHEYMISVLGMTVFDCAELWLLTERPSELYLVAGVYRTPNMQKWISLNENLRIFIGCDLPGRVLQTHQFVYERDYRQALRNWGEGESPRANAANRLSVQTALGVPIPGLRGSCCGVMVFYSSATSCASPRHRHDKSMRMERSNVEVDPLMVSLIEQAIAIIANTALDPASYVTPVDSEGNSIFVKRWMNTEPVPSQCTFQRRLQLLKKSNHAASDDGQLISMPEDFNQRLQLCRSIYQSKNRALDGGAEGADAAFEAGLANSAIKYNKRIGNIDSHSSSAVSSLSSCGGDDAVYSMNHSNAMSCTVDTNNFGFPSLHGQVVDDDSYTMTTNEVSDKQTGIINHEDSQSAAVVSAARTLANFWKVGWSSFVQSDVTAFEDIDAQSIKEKKRKNSNQAAFSSSNIIEVGADADTTSSKKMKCATGRSSSTDTTGTGKNLAKCKAENCTSAVESINSMYCALHKATRRCQHDGCTKCAQGATKFCIAHGGGRRCTYPGCFKGARDKFFCAAHGGGKRCVFDGCTKSAVGGSNLCTAHGGGKRCKFPGCTKSSQSSTEYCVKHGGGRTCQQPGCSKVARGKTDFCAAHGGGVRCTVKGCNKLAGSNSTLCRTHSTDNSMLSYS